jgi:hypothetical protein
MLTPAGTGRASRCLPSRKGEVGGLWSVGTLGVVHRQQEEVGHKARHSSLDEGVQRWTQPLPQAEKLSMAWYGVICYVTMMICYAIMHM